MAMNRSARLAGLLVLGITIALLAAACQGERRDRDAQKPAETPQPDAPRLTAPRGGTLVRVGDHPAFLEVLLDSQTGRLTVHVLDGSAEHPIRLVQSEIKMTMVLPPLEGETAGQIINITLNAVETAGDASEFSIELPKLVGHDRFAAVVGDLEIGGKMITGLNILYPEDVVVNELK